jgi:glutamate carboxypeptidase
LDSLLRDGRASAKTLSGSSQQELEALVGEAASTLEELVAISTPSGEMAGTERAVALCETRLPADATIERPPCSSPAHAPDLLARIRGDGSARLLLLGHLDTVVPHAEHVALQRDGNRWLGSGAVDMKGGVALALAVASRLAERRELFGELAVLLVVDEEWRLQPFAHLEPFAGFDACLCFEAGERTAAGEEAVVVERKAAGTLQVSARGRAAHAGSNPDAGANALLALAEAARAAAALHDPRGAQQLSVVPSRLQSGGAINVVPASGELMIDMRARSSAAFAQVIDAIPHSSHGASIEPELIRSWPGMDSREETAAVLARAGELLGRPIVGAARGGASDASHLAGVVAVTIDGLGPRGGHAHAPEEFVYAPSLGERLEIALALCEAIAEASSARAS